MQSNLPKVTFVVVMALIAACLNPVDIFREPPRVAAESILGGPTECPSCVFGPLAIVRADGLPRTQRFEFAADPAADYVVDLDDLGSQGADGSVTLNGQVLMAPRSDGELGHRHIRAAVALATQNTLVVRLTGRPGSVLKMMIIGGVKTVDTRGSTVTAPGSAVVMTIPPGALLTPVEIQISPAPDASFPQSLLGWSPAQAWRLSPSGLQLTRPATVVAQYEAFASAVTTADRNADIAVLHLDDASSAPEVLSVVHHAGTGTLTFQLSHFSLLFGGYTDPGKRWEVFGIRWGVREVTWGVGAASGFTYLSESLVQSVLQQWHAEQGYLTFRRVAAAESPNLLFEEGGTLSVMGEIPCALGFSRLYGHTCFPFTITTLRSNLQGNDQVVIRLASSSIVGDFPSAAASVAKSTLLHEVGHALGVAHNPKTFWTGFDDAPVMNNDIYFPTSLRPEDIAAIQYHYGAPSVGNVTRNYPDYCGGIGIEDGQPIIGCASATLKAELAAGGRTKVTVRIKNLQGSHTADQASWSFVQAVNVYYAHNAPAGEIAGTVVGTEGNVYQYGPLGFSASKWAFPGPITYGGKQYGGLYRVDLLSNDGAMAYGCGGRDRFATFFSGGIMTCERDGLDGWLLIVLIAEGDWRNDVELGWQIYTGNASSGELCLPVLGTCSSQPR